MHHEGDSRSAILVGVPRCCFGLPLYSAIAREAPATRLGFCRSEPLDAMSAIGTKRTSLFALHMSAFGGKADMTYCTANVCF